MYNMSCLNGVCVTDYIKANYGWGAIHVYAELIKEIQTDPKLNLVPESGFPVNGIE